MTFSRSTTRLFRRLVLLGGLGLFALWTGLPLYWIVVTSIKPNLLIYREPQLFPSQVTFDHFAFVLGQTPFLTYIRNSLSVTFVTTLLAMVIGTRAADAVLRLDFVG